MKINLSEVFRYLVIFHGIVASIVTILTTYPPLEIPKVIAGGHAGMWFTMGYLVYLITGVFGTYLLGKWKPKLVRP